MEAKAQDQFSALFFFPAAVFLWSFPVLARPVDCANGCRGTGDAFEAGSSKHHKNF